MRFNDDVLDRIQFRWNCAITALGSFMIRLPNTANLDGSKTSFGITSMTMKNRKTTTTCGFGVRIEGDINWITDTRQRERTGQEESVE